MPFSKLAVISSFLQSYGMDPFCIELFNNIVNGIYRNLWSSSSTLGVILSGISYFMGLSDLSLLDTAVRVMTTSGKHLPSAQFSAGILSNISFLKNT